MEYTKKDLGSYNLHLINTNKFKTITVRVIFHTPIKKDEVTKRTLLTDLLLQSSKNYKSRRELTVRSEELYSSFLSTNNQRLGNYILTSFDLNVLMDKYSEDTNIEKAIEFLSEIIFNPDTQNNKFNNEKLELVKHNARVKINSIKEDSTGYSLMKLSEAYDNTSPVSYQIIGYLEDLENIDTSNLYDTYNKMINNDYVDIFVVGDFNKKEMITTIKKYFKFKKIKKPKEDYQLKIKKPRKRRKIVKEEIDYSQSTLAIACAINKLSKYERDYSLLLANLILGGGVDSKLFKEVREANSLCYTINSRINRLDNLMIITAGIDKENFNKTVDLITKKIEDMKKGKITEDEINNAKELYKSSQEEIEENENRMINEVLSQEILQIDSLKDRIDNINKVKIKDIAKVCKKISMDTIFLLEGVENEED